jgi:hypothetical protein
MRTSLTTSSWTWWVVEVGDCMSCGWDDIAFAGPPFELAALISIDTFSQRHTLVQFYRLEGRGKLQQQEGMIG